MVRGWGKPMTVKLNFALLTAFMILSPALADSKLKPGRNIAFSEPEQKIRAWLTIYCPNDLKNKKMEGGPSDRIGQEIQTLQNFFDGKSEFITIATSKAACGYGNFFYSSVLDNIFADELKKLSWRAYLFKINSMGNMLKIALTQNNPYQIRHVILSCRDTGGAFSGAALNHIDLAIGDENCKDIKEKLSQKLSNNFNNYSATNKFMIPLQHMAFESSPRVIDHRIDNFKE